MSDSLLKTKLYIPSVRPELVPRPRLIGRLDACSQRKLTLISAPAGFGKTTLLTRWIRDSRLPVAWVSLDANDNDPMQFWAYVIAALKEIQPEVCETAWSLLRSPQPPPIESLLTSLINEIIIASERHCEGSVLNEVQGRVKGCPYILVLDDYHVIEAQAIHAGLIFLLDHLPPNLHLVIATRADPPLPLARLRARDKLLELRAADMRFMSDEVAAFLNQAMGLDLAEEAVAALEERTEGWITGLHLAALTLRSIPSKAEQVRFVQTFSGSHHYVLDYLLEEVLARQPAHVQDFLLQTAMLERLTASLCDAVRFGQDRSPAGQADSRTMLAGLDQANLFLVPLDDERQWYRYHRLFVALLRAHSGDDAQRAERHRRAAAWYQEQGFVADAFGHWLQAGAFAEAAALVEAQALVQLNEGRPTLVLAWIERLPSDLVADRPWLLVFQAWGLLLTGQVVAALALLEQVECAGTRTTDSELAGHIAAIRAYVTAMQGDVPTTIALAQQALEQLSPQSLSIRSVVALVLAGMRLLAGEIAPAQAAFAEAAQMGQAAGNLHLAVPAWCSVASLQAEQGQLRQAEATCRKALDLAMTSGGRPLPLAAQPCDELAYLAYEQNDLTAASVWLDQSLELCKQWSRPETCVSSLLMQVTLCLAQSDLDAASVACEEALTTAADAHLDPLSESKVAAKHLEFKLASGNVVAAARLATERNLAADDPISFVREAEQIALGRILLMQGRIGEAQELLARLVAAAQRDGRAATLIKLLILQAVSYQAQRKMEPARHALSRALSLAEPEGFVRVFLDEGQPLAGLLTQLPSAPFRDRLLAVFDVAATGHELSLIEPLSDRELEVLQLIAAGSSNQAVAEELIVALGTVKAHTAAIYRKLEVNSRTQAVARARELGLID